MFGSRISGRAGVVNLAVHRTLRNRGSTRELDIFRVVMMVGFGVLCEFCISLIEIGPSHSNV